jgi:hypothetical protein
MHQILITKMKDIFNIKNSLKQLKYKPVSCCFPGKSERFPLPPTEPNLTAHIAMQVQN